MYVPQSQSWLFEPAIKQGPTKEGMGKEVALQGLQWKLHCYKGNQ